MNEFLIKVKRLIDKFINQNWKLEIHFEIFLKRLREKYRFNLNFLFRI